MFPELRILIYLRSGSSNCRPSLAHCLLSCGPGTRNGFCIFKWFLKIKTRVILCETWKFCEIHISVPVNKVLLEHNVSHWCVFSMVALALQQQRCVVVLGTPWSTKRKIFAIWPLSQSILHIPGLRPEISLFTSCSLLGLHANGTFSDITDFIMWVRWLGFQCWKTREFIVRWN